MSDDATLIHIPLEALRVSPFNLRTPDDSSPEFAQLLASIEANGVLEPLVVEPTRLTDAERAQLQDGEAGSAAQSGGFSQHAITHDVLQGGHRLLALLKTAMRDGGTSHEAPCRVLEGLTASEAREAAVATSTIRRALHPVDEYEAFAALQAELTADARRANGDGAELIAQRFGLTTRQVRQRLRLAALAPEVRALWRAGGIGPNQAEAFTLARDHDHQRAVMAQMEGMSFYEAATKTRWLRRQFVEDSARESTDGNRWYALVGREAYLEAGGGLTSDLFGDHAIIEDPALLLQLAKAKALAEAQAHADRLGFGGVLWKPGMEEAWRWPRLRNEPRYTPEEEARSAEIEALLEERPEIDEDDVEAQEAEDATVRALEAEIAALEDAAALRALSPEDRARSAVVADVGRDGRIILEEGWLLVPTSAEQKAAATDGAYVSSESVAKAEASPEEPKDLPMSTKEGLAALMTGCCADAVRACPETAAPILIASIACGMVPHRGPLDSDMLRRGAGGMGQDFDAELLRILNGGAEAAAADMAGQVARLMRMSWSGLQQGQNAGVLLLIESRDEAFQQRLRDAFDPTPFFRSAPRPMLDAAAGEMQAEGYSASAAKKDMVPLLAAAARITGWLPALLRTARYALLTQQAEPEKAKGGKASGRKKASTRPATTRKKAA